jgi:NAD(P)-dependent dehydrogenase (short-subunit alcohol dehydrogenase family)
MLKDKYNANCSYLIADFSKLSDIHKVAKELLKLDRNIDVLIHNAGVYLTKKTFTNDNLETVFQTNYLSTFIINYYLKDKFIKQNSGRIIYVNSEAHRFAVWGSQIDDLNFNKHKYSGLKSYGSAKLAQLLSIIKFNELFVNTNVTINAMHPGNVKTNSGKDNGKLYKIFKKIIIDKNAKSIENSSESLYYLGVSKNIKNISGKFFNLTTIEEPAPPALDKEEADKLWNISLKLGGLK